MYFDMKLQREGKTYMTVCFSPEKHDHFKTRLESSSPLNISKYQIKRNNWNNQDDIHISKRTKLEDPAQADVNSNKAMT